MTSEWFNPNEDLFIPGTGKYSTPSHPDSYDIRQAPRTLEAPSGSPTANFDRETGTLIINFHDRLIHDEYIAKSLKWAKTEYGPDNVKFVELWVSDVAMVESGWWLDLYKFERQIDANSKTGLFRWRRELPRKRKVGEKKL